MLLQLHFGVKMRLKAPHDEILLFCCSVMQRTVTLSDLSSHLWAEDTAEVVCKLVAQNAVFCGASLEVGNILSQTVIIQFNFQCYLKGIPRFSEPGTYTHCEPPKSEIGLIFLECGVKVSSHLDPSARKIG